MGTWWVNNTEEISLSIRGKLTTVEKNFVKLLVSSRRWICCGGKQKIKDKLEDVHLELKKEPMDGNRREHKWHNLTSALGSFFSLF